MKRKHSMILIAALLTVVLTISTVLFSQKPTPQPPALSDGTTMAELLADGVVRVAFVSDGSPYVIQDAKGNLSGIEVELLQKVCASLGLPMEATLTSREEALNGVATGKYHLAAGMLCDDVATTQKLIYTNSYSVAGQVVVCKLDGPFQNLQSLSTENIGVKADSYAAHLLSRNEYTSTAFASYAEALQAVETDKVAALLVDRWVANQLLKGKPQAVRPGDLVVFGAEYDATGYKFAMAPGSDEVINRINIAVSQLAADGETYAIYEKYGALYYSPY